MAFFTMLTVYSDFGLLALRVAFGVIFIYHGYKKFGMWKMAPSDQMPSSMLNIMRFLSIAETLGGIAVVVGFLTQLAALGLGIIMIGAMYFKIAKWKVPFFAQDKTGWELDFILLAVAVALYFTGAGTFAVEKMLGWL